MYQAKNAKTGKEYEGRTIKDLLNAMNEISHIMGISYNPKPSTQVRQMIEDGLIEQVDGPDWYMSIEFGRSAEDYAEIIAEQTDEGDDEENLDNTKMRIIRKAAENFGIDYDQLWTIVETTLEHDIFPKFSSQERRAEFIAMIREIEELGTNQFFRLFAR